MGRKVIAQVSKAALLHNYDIVKSHAPNSRVIAMVKANAYGHGLIPIAKILHHADAFGVANSEEALKIRQAQLNNPIFLMEGFFSAEEIPWMTNHNLTPVIHCHEQLEALKNCPLDKPLNIWIKVNTGMNRLGFLPKDFNEVIHKVKMISHISLAGIMTHFPEADDTQSNVTRRQIQEFQDLVKNFTVEKSLANSAGILAWPNSHADWVRPGLMLYGASPFANQLATEFNLQPVMQLCAEVIAVHDLAPGEKVGYGGTWTTTDKAHKIAIACIGYGDGYPWHAQSGTPVLVNNQRCQVVGRVSMDMLAMDITHLDKVSVGDIVHLWGQDLPIEEVAKGATTIPYELFCRLTDRVSMQYVDHHVQFNQPPQRWRLTS